MPIKKVAASALLLFTLALLGCSGDSSSETKLTFVFTNATGEQISKTVECPKDISCENILSVPKEAWEPVPAATPCTKIWGGPERLSVVGKIRGETLVSNFSLSGGCEISRWRQVEPLLEDVLGSDYKGNRFASL